MCTHTTCKERGVRVAAPTRSLSLHARVMEEAPPPHSAADRIQLQAPGNGTPTAPAPPRLPPFKDAWDQAFIQGLANDLAYAELKTRLDAFAAVRDISMFDFLETPNMHVPLLYMDVRNRVRFTEGTVPSSAALSEGLARALLLLIRVYQDTCACEQVMGSDNVSHIPGLFHKKLCTWICSHFRARALQHRERPTTASPVRRAYASRGVAAADGTDRNAAAAAPRRTLTATEADILCTGWPPALAFLRVLERVRELVSQCTALPLPVWVPRVYRSAMPGTFTIYFQDALSTMKAAASNNHKIEAVRTTAASTMLAALDSLTTWNSFQALTFTTKVCSEYRRHHQSRSRASSAPLPSGAVASHAGFTRVVSKHCST